MSSQSPEFKETRWSLILHARGSDEEVAQRALSELCELYWFPLYGFVRRQGYSTHDAEDLIQAFLARFLAREDFDRADPERGRLRSYLLGALKNFLANERAKAGAAKRGGGRVIVSLDAEWAESRLKIEPADSGLSPDELYDRRWALHLLDRALAEVRKDYRERGKDGQFSVLEKFLAWNAGEDFAKAAESLGMSESGVRVAVHRLRQRYTKALRRQVADTVDSEADLEEELRRLPDLLR